MNYKNFCFECRKHVGNLDKHLKTVKHKSKLYQVNYDDLCKFCNCMKIAQKNGYCKSHKHKAKSKYKSLDDVKCPICNGVINEKWLNFRNGNVIEFIAECWSGNLDTADQPRHIFYFQLEVPDAKLYPAKGSKVFDT